MSLICKHCASFIDEGQFSLLNHVPDNLTKTTYCASCYDEKVAPYILIYEQNLQKARDVFVFSKAESKETRVIKRKAQPVRVEDCPDYDEAILRLAFLAAQNGYNAIVDIDLHPKKLIINNYQSTQWTGTAQPAHVNAEKLLANRPIISNMGT